MNKRFFAGNLKESVNLNLLKGKFEGKRCLVVRGKDLDLKRIPELRDYFHIVIADGVEAVETLKDPDIVIYRDPSPYNEGVFHFNQHVNKTDTLYLVNYKTAQMLRKIRYLTSSPMLTFACCGSKVESMTSKHDGIDFGVNEKHTGEHVCWVAGAKDVYTYGVTAERGISLNYSQLIDFIEEKDRWIPKNLVGTGRKKFFKSL